MKKLGSIWHEDSHYNDIGSFLNVVDHIYGTDFLEKLFQNEINITPKHFNDKFETDLSWIFSISKVRKCYFNHFDLAGFGDLKLNKNDLERIKNYRARNRYASMSRKSVLTPLGLNTTSDVGSHSKSGIQDDKKYTSAKSQIKRFRLSLNIKSDDLNPRS